jgi:precorrin-2 dehydrogenase/sirohydrochlorin ferrochelatase
MVPILLDLTLAKVVLTGEGEAFSKRLALLTDGGNGADFAVYTNGKRPTSDVLEAAQVVFVAGLDAAESAGIAAIVRGSGGLVNVEDVKPLCDFHMPSTVRRGDLVLTVSTGGKSPGLARRLRRYLENMFGPEWAGRLNELAEKRDDWRRQDLEVAEIGRRTDRYVEEKGWLP